MRTGLMSLLLLLLWSACNEVEKQPVVPTTPSSWPGAAAFDTVLDGKQVRLFYLKNGRGMRAAVTNYGARMVAFEVPDSAGQPVDIVLGLPGIRDYILAEERFFWRRCGSLWKPNWEREICFRQQHLSTRHQ